MITGVIKGGKPYLRVEKEGLEKDSKMLNPMQSREGEKDLGDIMLLGRVANH